MDNQSSTIRRKALFWLIGAIAMTVMVIIGNGLWRAFIGNSHAYTPIEGPLVNAQQVASLEAQNQAYTAIAKAVLPAIVNISTTRIVKIKPEEVFPFLKTPFSAAFSGRISREFRKKGAKAL